MDITSFKVTEELINKQPMVYARRVGAYGAENAALMEKFKAWADKCGYITSKSCIFGIAQDDPNVILPQNCRYDVCLLGIYNADEEWVTPGIFTGGQYIVLEIPHTSDAIALVWKEGVSFLAQRYELDFAKPVIERYQKKLVDNHLCEMLFPVV